MLKNISGQVSVIYLSLKFTAKSGEKRKKKIREEKKQKPNSATANLCTTQLYQILTTHVIRWSWRSCLLCSATGLYHFLFFIFFSLFFISGLVFVFYLLISAYTSFSLHAHVHKKAISSTFTQKNMFCFKLDTHC